MALMPDRRYPILTARPTLWTRARNHPEVWIGVIAVGVGSVLVYDSSPWDVRGVAGVVSMQYLHPAAMAALGLVLAAGGVLAVLGILARPAWALPVERLGWSLLSAAWLGYAVASVFGAPFYPVPVITAVGLAGGAASRLSLLTHVETVAQSLGDGP